MKHDSISTFAALVCKLILVCFTCVSGQEANSLLWRVTARNGKVSHLYGTCHSNLRSAFMFREPALQAYKNANAVAVEVASSDKDKREDPNVRSAGLSMAVKLSETMASWRLSPENRLELRDTLKALVARLVPMLCKVQEKSFDEIESEHGYTSTVNNAIKNIQTDSAEYLIGLVITMRDELKRANRVSDTLPTVEALLDDYDNLLDNFIWKSAKADGKRVVELDDRQKVVSASIGLVGAISDPMKVVRDAGIDDIRIWEMYQREQIADMPAIGRESLDRKTYRSLFEDRNSDWIRVLKPLLDSHTCFVAIGAAHLAGEQGLIRLLRSNGMKVEPVLGGERVDIRNHIGVSHNPGFVRSEKVAAATSRDASFKASIEDSLRSYLRRINQHGLLTLIISITRNKDTAYDENDQISIDFTDREDLLSEIQTIVRKTASSSESYLRLDVNHTYNIVIQLEY